MLNNVTPAEVKRIATVPKCDGLRILARFLRVNTTELEDDLRAASFLDYHYNVLRFSADRGMPWCEVKSCLVFASRYFQNMVDENFPQAICTLRNQAAEFVQEGKLRVESAKKLLRYFVSSILSHHKLYQFVFKHDRQDETKKLDLLVQVPDLDAHLKEALSLEHWKYEQQVKDVKNEHQRKVDEATEKENLLNEKAKSTEEDIDQRVREKETAEIIDLKSAEDFLSSLVSDHIEVIKNSTDLGLQKLTNTAQTALSLKAIPVPPNVQPHTLASQLGVQEKHVDRKRSAKSPA